MVLINDTSEYFGVYSYILISASLIFAVYQDIRERAVSDLVWLPALAGIIYSMVSNLPSIQSILIKVGLVGAIALAFTLYGSIGQADAIALVIIAFDPFYLSPIIPLFASAVIALIHISYELTLGEARSTHIIPLSKFKEEQRWIPKAVISKEGRIEVSKNVNKAREEVILNAKGEDSMVEVSYGVPTVAYIGIGYLAYIMYLIIFYPYLFFKIA